MIITTVPKQATANLTAAQTALQQYRELPQAELQTRIAAAKETLGSRVLILGHHYQKDEVIQFADLRGDSLKLSQQAAAASGVSALVFCGVHFMAETADILTEPDIPVILPDLSAGCSMADMADIDQVEDCWADLADMVDTNDITPVTYINSTAALKAFCGRHEGIVCTSSNATRVLEWGWQRRSRLLFFPDQHLGRNTAKRMGVPLDQMVVWDPRQPRGGNSPEQLRQAKVYLWRGWCSVHQMFKPEHVQQWRERDPEIQILVHPECCMEVVDLADQVGSTDYIIRTLQNAPTGTHWAVGTELHLVNRLKAERPDLEVHFLSPMVCMCATMYRIDLPHLCWTLEELVQGRIVNQVRVPDDIRHWSLVALQRMLDLG